MSAAPHAAIVGPLVAALLTLTGTVGRQQPAKPTRTVTLYVSVEDDGRLIQGLTATQFAVYEGNVARPFHLVPPDVPASIALLVENSDTARQLFAEELRGAVNGFVAAAPDEHWYALASFAHAVSIDVDFTRVPGRLATAMTDLPASTWNESDVRDAVIELLDRMDRLGGRRILIVIASGIDSSSRHSWNEVQRALERSNVVVFTIGLGAELRHLYEPYWDPSARDALSQGEMFLRSLATASGGQAVFPMFSQAFGDVLDDVVKEVASQYRLDYESVATPDQALHKVRVDAVLPADGRPRRLTVHCRTGWRF